MTKVHCTPFSHYTPVTGLLLQLRSPLIRFSTSFEPTKRERAVHVIRHGAVRRVLCTSVYSCSHIAPIHINWLGDQASHEQEGEGSPGQRQPRQIAHRPQHKTEDCDLSRIILQYVLLAFLLPHFLRELYFLAGVEADCIKGLAHKRLMSLLHSDETLPTNSAFNPLKTKRKPLHLKTQFVPRSKQI